MYAHCHCSARKINSQAEEDQVTAFIAEYELWSIWLGAKKNHHDPFRWVKNKQNLNYTAWGEGEPNAVK